MKPDVRYVRNGDVSLAYQVVGDGPQDLFLVSGYLSNIEYAWLYPSLARFLSRLAGSTRLILNDRRGSGLSDRFREPQPEEVMLSDLEAVLDEVGSTRAALLGLWDGCGTSLLFAATHPERVSALILLTASAAQKPAEDYPWAWGDDRWEEWLASIRDGWGTRAWVVKNARWMSPSMLVDPGELDHWITYTRVSSSPSSAEAVMRTSSDTDIREILPLVRVPTLILHRLGDQIEPIEGARYMVSKLPNARLVELAGDDGIPWLGDTEPLLREIEAFIGTHEVQPVTDRRLGTVLFTDIVGSTQLVASLGDAVWRRRLGEHDRIARQAIEHHAGRFVDSAGDGILATFEGPAAAVRCGQDIADAVPALDLQVRGGVHTGEIELDGGKVRGIAVHIGSRICSLAPPGGVLVSSTVKDLTAGSGLVFEDAGEHELKGVPDRWRLYRVVG